MSGLIVEAGRRKIFACCCAIDRVQLLQLVDHQRTERCVYQATDDDDNDDDDYDDDSDVLVTRQHSKWISS